MALKQKNNLFIYNLSVIIITEKKKKEKEKHLRDVHIIKTNLHTQNAFYNKFM